MHSTSTLAQRTLVSVQRCWAPCKAPHVCIIVRMSVNNVINLFAAKRKKVFAFVSEAPKPLHCSTKSALIGCLSLLALTFGVALQGAQALCVRIGRSPQNNYFKSTLQKQTRTNNLQQHPSGRAKCVAQRAQHGLFIWHFTSSLECAERSQLVIMRVSGNIVAWCR